MRLALALFCGVAATVFIGVMGSSLLQLSKDAVVILALGAGVGTVFAVCKT